MNISPRCSTAAVCVLAIGLSGISSKAAAESVVAAHTIRSNAILQESDMRVDERSHPDAVSEIKNLVGLETREILYAGRPIRPSQVGPPTLVRRNDIVAMHFHAGSIQIATEGRALGQASLGEAVRVMNLTSRNTVTAIVQGPSRVFVGTTLQSEGGH